MSATYESALVTALVEQTIADARTRLSDPVTAAEIAAVMGLGIQTVYAGWRTGAIPSTRIGGKGSNYITPRAVFVAWWQTGGAEAFLAELGRSLEDREKATA